MTFTYEFRACGCFYFRCNDIVARIEFGSGVWFFKETSGYVPFSGKLYAKLSDKLIAKLWDQFIWYPGLQITI